MHRILMIISCSMLLSGCSIFKKPHDQPIKSYCDVCKHPPFYVNGQRLYDQRHKR